MAEPRRLNGIRRRLSRMGCAVVALLLGWGMWTVTRPSPGIDFHKDLAHLACQSLAHEVEAYTDSPSNLKHEFPNSLNDLVHPPWGGSSFLRKNEAELIDPWGHPYQMERRTTADGRNYPFVWTTAPDGMRISNFGFGPKADPKL